MNKAKIKRITGRTEFWIFLVLIIMCIAIQAVSGGQLFESSTVVTILHVCNDMPGGYGFRRI